MSKRLNKIKIDFILGKISYDEFQKQFSEELTQEIYDNAITTIKYFERNKRMKKFKPKYTYAGDSNGNIYAISTYAGKTVRGVAKYNPKDKFDEKTGKELAAARCNQKVAKKRLARAIKKVNEAQEQFAYAQAYLTKMEDYFVLAEDAYNNALLETAELEAKLK